MKSAVFTTFLLLSLPSLLSAEEPLGGTLIEMSGVGGFILTMCFLFFLAQKNPDGKLARFASKIFPNKR